MYTCAHIVYKHMQIEMWPLTSTGFLMYSQGEWRSWMKGEKYPYRPAHLTPCWEENWDSEHLPLLFGCLPLVFLCAAPGCVLKVLSEARVSRRHEERKEGKRAQIKAYFLKFLCDSSLTISAAFVKRKKKTATKQKGRTCFSSFSTFFSTFSFYLDFSWVDMLCSSPVSPTVLNSCGSNTSWAQPINHRGAWQTNHLLMKRRGHEFLTAFVLFIKLDQTMGIQTSLKQKG